MGGGVEGGGYVVLGEWTGRYCRRQVGIIG